MTINAQIRALAQQIHALTDNTQVKEWAQDIYDASPDPVAPSGDLPLIPMLTLFEHDGYTGKDLQITAAASNLWRFDFNDKASSAIAIGRWECYADANYTGSRVVLEPGEYPSLRKYGMNDSISSCRPVGVVQKSAGPKYFGYFYSDEAQPAETADHCNLIHVPHVGEMGLAILRAAKAAGIGKAVISMDACGFTEAGGGRKVYRGPVTASQQSSDYLSAINKAGLLGMIVGMYTVDEPEREADVPADDLRSFCAALRGVIAAWELPSTALAICYGSGDFGGRGRDYRAIEAHDWIGRDAYDEGEGALGEPYDDLVARLRDDQRVILVPGCASPWRADPGPWLARAEDERVAWLMPFDWTGYGGKLNGLRHNPALQPAYRAAGKAIIAAST